MHSPLQVDARPDEAVSDGARTIELRLVGPIRVTSGDGRDLTPVLAKARGLLALLGTARDLRRPRPWLQDKLWSASAPAQGANSLRQTVARLRAALGPAGACLIAERGCLDPLWTRVRLDAAEVHLDLGDDPPTLFEGLDIGDPEFEHWVRDTRFAFEERTAAIGVERVRRSRASSLGLDHVPRAAARGGRPRVAVLFVAGAGGEAGPRRFVADLVADLVAALRLCPDVTVVAPSAGGGVDVAADLEAHADALRLSYLIVLRFGSSSDGRTLAVHLVEARSSAVRWSARHTLPAQDFAAAREAFADAIACELGGMNGAIVRLERERLSRCDLIRGDAYELYLRAGDGLEFDGEERSLAAVALAERCVEVDPHFARGWLMLNWRRHRLLTHGWGENPTARENAVFWRAVELEPRDPVALGYLALARAKLGLVSEARRLIERAAELAADRPDAGPDLEVALSTVAGDARRALALIDRALWRNGSPPAQWGFFEARAAFFAGDHKRALAASDVAPDCMPKLVFRALAAVEAGNRAEAAVSWKRLKALAPGFDPLRYAASLPITDPSALARYRAAMAKSRRPTPATG